MAETKQLVLVVEGTDAMAPHWSTIRSNYLDKIIRSFCDNESLWLPDKPIVELALVNFKIQGPHSSFLVQRSNWTKDMDIFMNWLSAIDFSVDGIFFYADIAQGLAEALMMFPCVKLGQNHQRHCILIASSDPEPFPTLVYNPPETGSHLSVAKTVAESFQRCLISLSVISPNQLSELEAIYNSARRNPSETDPTIGIVKYPNHLILISKDFMEARTALSKPEIANSPLNKSPTIIDLTGEEEMTSPMNVNVQIPKSVVPKSYGQAESATSRMPTNLVNDNVSTNVGPSSHTNKVQIWEGDLYNKAEGEKVLVASLKCYTKRGVSDSIVKDWQSTMHIEMLVPQQDFIDNREYIEKADIVAFKAISDQLFLLEELREKKLGMAIKLPSQMLFLFVSPMLTVWLGMVISQETVIYNTPQIKEQPQQGQHSSKGQQRLCIDLNN